MRLSCSQHGQTLFAPVLHSTPHSTLHSTHSTATSSVPLLQTAPLPEGLTGAMGQSTMDLFRSEEMQVSFFLAPVTSEPFPAVLTP